MARVKTDGSVRYYHVDALGSVIALTDEIGAVKTQYSYDPFGNVTISGEASDNPFQYTGRENDGTGLYYYRARYYSPELQRFISEDPIRFEGGINFYAYAGNQPVNFVDPSGNNIYGKWCGPGGSGPVKDGVDQCCHDHDKCYNDGNATWVNNVFGTGGKEKQQCIKDCNKELCECLRKFRPKDSGEETERLMVMMAFGCK